MKIAELRHLDGVRGNFGVSETEYIAATIATSEKSDLTTIPHAIYSNIKEDIQQQQYVFEIGGEIWAENNAGDEGTTFTFILPRTS